MPTECKFLGKPIDFLVFKGLDDNDVNEIVFVEVKSGNSKLNSNEKKIKNAVKDKKVNWSTEFQRNYLKSKRNMGKILKI